MIIDQSHYFHSTSREFRPRNLTTHRCGWLQAIWSLLHMKLGSVKHKPYRRQNHHPTMCHPKTSKYSLRLQIGKIHQVHPCNCRHYLDNSNRCVLYTNSGLTLCRSWCLQVPYSNPYIVCQYKHDYRGWQALLHGLLRLHLLRVSLKCYTSSPKQIALVQLGAFSLISEQVYQA